MIPAHIDFDFSEQKSPVHFCTPFPMSHDLIPSTYLVLYIDICPLFLFGFQLIPYTDRYR